MQNEIFEFDITDCDMKLICSLEEAEKKLEKALKGYVSYECCWVRDDNCGCQDFFNLLVSDGKAYLIIRKYTKEETISEEINALPKRLRDYIHDLETNCDPAGTVQSLFAAKENVNSLQVENEKLKADIEAAENEKLKRKNELLEEILKSIHDKMSWWRMVHA